MPDEVAPSPELARGDVLVTHHDGKVLIVFPEPVAGMRFDPSNAQEVAANMASHAYEAHFGRAPPDTPSAMLAQYVKAKAVDDVRPILVRRVELILRSSSRTDLAWLAQLAVDAVLKEVT